METSDKTLVAILAVREALMDYFKGTCIETMTEGNLTWDMVPAPAAYQYQRQEAQIRQARALRIGNIPILKVEKSPDRLTFYVQPLTRSPQMRELYEAVKDFSKDYLMDTELIHSREKVL